MTPGSAVWLDPAGLEEMQEIFLTRVPDFGDFTDRESWYWVEERAYKEEMVQVFEAIVLPAVASAEDSVEGAAGVVNALMRMLTVRLNSAGGPQNIVGWRYHEFLRHLAGGERMAFARSFRDLLHGPGGSPERVERFVSALWPILKRLFGGNPYALTRIFPTFFLMLRHPARDIAVRTDMFVRAERLLGAEQLLRYRPFGADDYRRVMAFVEAVRRALLSWGWLPCDMIDVHSFLWIATRTNEEWHKLQDHPATESK